MYLVTDKDYFWHQNDDCKCKTSFDVLSHSHWGLGQFVGGEGVVKKKSLDLRSPEIGISELIPGSL